MKPYKEISLGSEATAYIKECLANGKTLSSLISRLCDISSGRVVTSLPHNVSDEAAKNFESGGKIVASVASVHHFTGENGAKWRVEPKFNTNDNLITEIDAFLRSGDERICVFEDQLANIGDPFLQTLDLRYSTYKDEVYYVLTKADAGSGRILKSIQQARSWLFIGIMSSLPIEMYRHLDFEKFDLDILEVIAERTEKILVGAYDGEGYLVWNKS